MTGPGGGSDLAALRTTAVRESDTWVLNGSKTFITTGYSADLVVVAARTSLERKAHGITLIGEVDRGFVHMMERLPQERLGGAVANLAHAAQILAETIEYTKQRKAFGQAIGSFQCHKFLLWLRARLALQRPDSSG
ncbi:acyl-CoA dehydrogenase family protein [Streptomyces xinghaiensis]|uniref:acyl-CoA dehydrogenase family protein n=1 Tax=Streptomyces xinghaiensis TaxID=1038928 RepID=UPI0034266F77